MTKPPLIARLLSGLLLALGASTPLAQQSLPPALTLDAADLGLEGAPAQVRLHGARLAVLSGSAGERTLSVHRRTQGQLVREFTLHLPADEQLGLAGFAFAGRTLFVASSSVSRLFVLREDGWHQASVLPGNTPVWERGDGSWVLAGCSQSRNGDGKAGVMEACKGA